MSFSPSLRLLFTSKSIKTENVSRKTGSLRNVASPVLDPARTLHATIPVRRRTDLIPCECFNCRRSPMNKADSERIQQLCSLIAAEKNRHKFLALVEELNRILAAKDSRLQNGEVDDQEPR